MKNVIASLIAAAPLVVVACGASFPAPTQPMADAQSADRSAIELGANAEPEAQLHLKLAEEQIKQAEAAMKNGDNERAHFLLLRAKADAELAVALAKERNAKIATQKAGEDATTQTKTNIIQGAKQ